MGLPRFSAYLPSTAVDGDLDQLCLTVGECAGNIGAILPARRIVEEMTRDCLACIGRLAMHLPALEPDAA